MSESNKFFDLKNKKFLNGILVGAAGTLLVCVLSFFLMYATVLQPPEPPTPLVTAEQVVEAGYGVIHVNEETQERSFKFYSQKEVHKKYHEMKRKERSEKVKGFFSGIWNFLKKPF
jgi:hypothetical protein